MAVATTTGFLVMRFIIFHGDGSAEARAQAQPEISADELSVDVGLGELVGPRGLP